MALAATGVPFAYRSIGDPAAWSAAASRRRAHPRCCLRRARLVTVLWHGAADVLVQPAAACAADRIRVVPNGRRRRPLPGARRRATAWPPAGASASPRTRQVVAYMGSLTAEKQVDDAIAAVARLAGVHLLVAGHGPERAALEAPGRP